MNLAGVCALRQAVGRAAKEERSSSSLPSAGHCWNQLSEGALSPGPPAPWCLPGAEMGGNLCVYL